MDIKVASASFVLSIVIQFLTILYSVLLLALNLLHGMPLLESLLISGTSLILGTVFSTVLAGIFILISLVRHK